MPKALYYVLFPVAVVLIGGVIGYLTAPGAWFQTLNKPFFQPPDWLFAPVWTTLYVLIGIAGARVYTRPNSAGLQGLWLVQMVLNFLWSPLFFTAQSPTIALFVIILMLAAIYAFLWMVKPKDKISFWLFVPYAAWVSFATVLNLAIVWLN